MWGGLEVSQGNTETRLDCVQDIKNSIADSVQDSRLTVDEADTLNYKLLSSIDTCQDDTFRELKESAQEVLISWINIEKWSNAEWRIWKYYGVDFPWMVNYLESKGYNIPDNYSVRNNGKYLVFHDANWKDIATMNWDTYEIWGGWLFIWNDDLSDNMNAWDLADSYEINARWMNEEKMDEIDKLKKNMFDANIIFEDPFDYASISLASESFWLSEWEFKNMVINFQKQVIQDGHSPYQEDIWKNIWLFERGGNELWFNQRTPNWPYVWIYDRNGNFQKWGIWN